MIVGYLGWSLGSSRLGDSFCSSVRCRRQLAILGRSKVGTAAAPLMEERYEALKELGAGNFGVARLVRDKRTKELVAVKYIERGKKVRSSVSRLGLLAFFRLSFVLEFGGLLVLLLLNSDWRGVFDGRFRIRKMGVSV